MPDFIDCIIRLAVKTFPKDSQPITIQPISFGKFFTTDAGVARND